MKIRHQNGEWWKFADNGEGINRVKIIDTDNRPLTDEILKELGFERRDFKQETFGEIDEWHIWVLKGKFVGTLVADKYAANVNDRGEYRVSIEEAERDPTVYFAYWKTVGSVKMLIEALKGDE